MTSAYSFSNYISLFPQRFYKFQNFLNSNFSFAKLLKAIFKKKVHFIKLLVSQSLFSKIQHIFNIATLTSIFKI
jgi:hypothetical protein